MEHNVIAEIEIGETRIDYYTSIVLRQQFNAHHEFTIRINHDVLESQKSFSIQNAQQLFGKPAILRFKKIAEGSEVAYEFRGVVFEISMEQSNSFTGDLVIKGYSPTIILDSGENLASFGKKKLESIVQQLTQGLSSVNCTVTLNTSYKKEIKYICQYRESTFAFLNRLSSVYSEWFYYDGKELFFGKPPKEETIDVVYGSDITGMQLKLKMMPMNFRGYSYNAKDDTLITAAAPEKLNGLGQHANYILNASKNLFSEAVNSPIRQRADNKTDLQQYLHKQKASLAAGLEVLSGSGSNPAISIGAVINLKVSQLEDGLFKKEDYGKFVITSIEHHIGDSGKYYNTFEALPAGVEVIPVQGIKAPAGEPQVAIVKANNDPDNLGRIRVQMLWQKEGELTDWIRVMTPDAGGGNGGAPNRGFVFIPELEDQVLVCFRYNDPNRPFVLGSLFHGKTGGGGGEGNKSKSLTALSGSIISLNGDAVTVKDAKGNAVHLDGTGNIAVTSSKSITLTCGDSSVVMTKEGTIEIKAKKSVLIAGDSEAVTITSDQLVKIDSQSKVEIEGTQSVAVKSTTKVDIQAAATNIQGDATLSLESAVVQIDGTGVTNVKGGLLNLNCG